MLPLLTHSFPPRRSSDLLRPREHPLGMGHEKVQQAEFGRADRQRLLIARQAMRNRIELQPADIDDVVSELGRAPSQHRLDARHQFRSEEHTSELQSLMRISYAVFCLKKKKTHKKT